MPVVAKQKTVEQLYEYQIQQAGLAVLDTVRNTLHQSLHIFRVHNQKCAVRRKNALSYELRQESQKTEWLKRKYLDSARQQQQVIAGPPAVSTRMDSSASANKTLEHVVDANAAVQVCMNN